MQHSADPMVFKTQGKSAAHGAGLVQAKRPFKIHGLRNEDDVCDRHPMIAPTALTVAPRDATTGTGEAALPETSVREDETAPLRLVQVLGGNDPCKGCTVP